jgi:16S rRNA C1402 N4-methylase RsmH
MVGSPLWTASAESGVSSHQFDTGRVFSLQLRRTARYAQEQRGTSATILLILFTGLSTVILRDYGEEKCAYRIAQNI